MSDKKRYNIPSCTYMKRGIQPSPQRLLPWSAFFGDYDHLLLSNSSCHDTVKIIIPKTMIPRL